MYAKRGIIKTLNAQCFSACYDEMIRFATARQDQEDRCLKQAGVYVPYGIVPVEESGCQIQDGDDNDCGYQHPDN